MPSFTPQPTPNPNAYKFVADRPLREGPASTFYSAAAAEADPVAKRLFGLEGVTGVMILNNFCSVNKSAEASWEALLPAIDGVLVEAFGDG